MKNLKVSQKLLVGFGAVIILTVALSVFAIVATYSMDAEFMHLLGYNVERTVALHEVNTQFLTAKRSLSHMGVYAGLEGATEGINSLKNDVEQSLARVDAGLDKYVSLVNSDNNISAAQKSSRIALATKIKDLKNVWNNDVVKPVIQANLDGRREDVLVIAVEYAAVSNELFDDVESLLELANETTQNISESSDRFALSLVAISAFVVLVSVGFAVIIPRQITKPLKVLTNFMQKAGSTGDITLKADESAEFDKYAQNKDEIGQCIGTTAKFVNHIVGASQSLKEVADGDLSNDIKVLSRDDLIGNSLHHMNDNLNNIFDEISASSHQVTNGARHISEGAQNLAQGATEQAAAVEQLFASILLMANKTKSNAESAGRAAELAETIKGSAELGSKRMDEMTSAVNDINNASQSIGKVIKTIDEIAFQTNILALNAAVEAARAGQHGKGFAVVAEEVRDLAAKSAIAAKDTGDLIRDSIDKAELGTRIAGETAVSLAQIVSGINESGQLISEIATISKEQSSEIEHINVGIDQVSQVVQHTSATAQESAAASEQMSSQAAVLMHFISQFKLKGGQRAPALPDHSSVQAM